MRCDIDFIEEIFSNLESTGIKYCILRNADEVASGTAHDIDMTLDSGRLLQAEEILMRAAKALGWRLHLRMGSTRDSVNIKSYHFYRLTDNYEKDCKNIFIVHFDIFPTFVWNGRILLENRHLLESVDTSTIYHRASPPIEAVTELFVRLLHNGYVKDKYKPFIRRVFSECEEGVNSVLLHFLDISAAQLVTGCVKAGDWGRLQAERDILTKSIRKCRPAHIPNRCAYLLSKAAKKSGVMIVLEGADGSGKSTVAEGLPAVLGNSFPEGMTDYYHWRPNFIMREKRDEGENQTAASSPHSKPPHGRLKSAAKFLLCNLDYVAGYWLKCRWQLAKGHLVIFDRYYYDYYCDKARYRLNISDRAPDMFSPIIPAPSVTFILCGNAQTLHERKSELSEEEINLQNELLLKNRHKFGGSVIVDANQSADRVLHDVAKEILDICAKRYERR